ncbi:lipopolysaccharide biosynthesis protein [Psychrobacter sp. DAB_AL62B]|uniref:lipopolysaccharide biosynthesis protein n=1 Tax=Psychrobacter sp. DAB_AL62B TaxID=1028420 RepID=UPI002380D0E1|nr:oligosaccharide flippase family protein [Psychrobacter sp. DAB_AL62B]MDE4455140.1 polysaccharide biosynthesis protein [Psychrobacter sp. DAB_AL62B]
MSTIKKVVKFGSGIVLAQIITAFSIPFLSRIYTPEDFSLFGVYFSIASVLVVFVTLKLETTLPKEDDIASKLPTVISVAWITAIPILCIAFLILSFLNSQFDIVYILVAFLILFASITFNFFNTINILNVREDQIGVTNKARILRSSSSVFLQISFMSIKGGLFLGEVFARFIGLISLSRKSYYKIHIRQSLFLIKSKNKYIQYVVTSSFLNSLGLNLYPILILRFYDPILIGKYFFIHKVLSAPVTVMAQSISIVLLGDFKNIIKQDKRKLINKMHKVCALFFILSILLFVFIGIIFKYFEVFIFGDDWLDIHKFVFVLIPLLVGQIAFSPFSQLLILVKGEKKQLLWDIVRMLFITFSIVFPVYFKIDNAFMCSLLFYSISNFVLYIIHYFLLIKSIQRYSYD